MPPRSEPPWVIPVRLPTRQVLWLAPSSQPLAQVAGTAPKPPATLPVSQVVLFNSGVGYFARSGEVEGAARVELSFPESDINDLLKSLTLQDFNGGRVDAVTYDSRGPAGRTLASFAINLGQNPTLADILTQARGERVELVASLAGGTGPQPFGGTIVSLEHRVAPPVAPDARPAEFDVLNLLTADGLRAFKLPEVVRVKFANPALEAELKRALEVLARSHDAQKNRCRCRSPPGYWTPCLVTCCPPSSGQWPPTTPSPRPSRQGWSQWTRRGDRI